MAVLEPTNITAVTVETQGLVTLLMAEGIFQWLDLPKGAPGRPGIFNPIIPCLMLAAAAQLLPDESSQLTAISLGAGGTVLALLLNIKRIIQTENVRFQLPGPKVWPAVAALISFIGILVFKATYDLYL